MVSLGILGRALRGAGRAEGSGLLPALALAGGGAALAGNAMAQEASPVDDAQKRVSDLESELELFSNPTTEDQVKEIQRRLRGANMYRGAIDGDWKGKTQEGAAQYVPQLEANLATARQQLTKATGDQAYLETHPLDEGRQFWRDKGGYILPAAGLALGLGTRFGLSRIPAMAANKLLTKAGLPLRPARGKAAIAAVEAEAGTRAANLNEFWRLGGAGERVPFKTPQRGLFSKRLKPSPADPSSLFPPNKGFKLKDLLSPDVGVMSLGGGEALVMEGYLQGARRELEAAEAEVKTRPTKAAWEKYEAALDNVKNLEAWQRGGLGLATGHLAGMKLFKNARPNVALAEKMRFDLNNFLK